MATDKGWLDLSAIFRETSCATTGILKHIGGNVVDNIEVEFTRMVKETPQWTGSTAASWYVGIHPLADSAKAVKLPDRSRSQALIQGDQPAVGISLGRANFGKIREKIATTSAFHLKSIMVENNAEGFDRSESGENLRAGNNPGMMMARFQQNVSLNMGKHKALLDQDYFSKYRRTGCK